MPSSEQKCYDDSEGLRDQVRISVWWARQVLPIPRMNQNYTQICWAQLVSTGCSVTGSQTSLRRRGHWGHDQSLSSPPPRLWQPRIWPERADSAQQRQQSRIQQLGHGDQSSLGQTGMCSPSRRRRGHWFSSSSCRQTCSKQPKDLVQRPKLVYLGQNHFLFLL